MSYIDWEYYNSHFPKVNEEKFKELLPAAETKVEIYTHYRCLNVAGYKLDQVKAAVANLINTMSEQEKLKEREGINSVSNDGYSESYTQVTREQREETLKNVCYEWLSGTGLMGCL